MTDNILVYDKLKSMIERIETQIDLDHTITYISTHKQCGKTTLGKILGNKLASNQVVKIGPFHEDSSIKNNWHNTIKNLYKADTTAQSIDDLQLEALGKKVLILLEIKEKISKKESTNIELFMEACKTSNTSFNLVFLSDKDNPNLLEISDIHMHFPKISLSEIDDLLRIRLQNEQPLMKEIKSTIEKTTNLNIGTVIKLMKHVLSDTKNKKIVVEHIEEMAKLLSGVKKEEKKSNYSQKTVTEESKSIKEKANQKNKDVSEQPKPIHKNLNKNSSKMKAKLDTETDRESKKKNSLRKLLSRKKVS